MLYRGALSALTVWRRAVKRKEVLDQEPKEKGKGFCFAFLFFVCLLVILAV